MEEFKKEKNICTCKDCGSLGTRITDAKYDKKNYKYIDENGKFWNGRRCPSCHRKAMKLRMQEKRANGT